MNDIIIDPEFENILDAYDNSALEQELIDSGGPSDALVVWKEENILIDGHNRYRICEKHGLAFGCRFKSFPNREEALIYAIKLQDTRRNMTEFQRAASIRKRQELYAKLQGISKTEAIEEVAKEENISKRTAYRSVQLAKSMENLNPEWQALFSNPDRNRKTRIPSRLAGKIARLDPAEQTELYERVTVEVLDERSRFLEDYFAPPTAKLPEEPEPIPEVPVLDDKEGKKQIKKKIDAFVRSLLRVEETSGQLFGPAGLDNKNSVWHKRYLAAFTEINKVLKEIKEATTKR